MWTASHTSFYLVGTQQELLEALLSDLNRNKPKGGTERGDLQEHEVAAQLEKKILNIFKTVNTYCHNILRKVKAI